MNAMNAMQTIHQNHSFHSFQNIMENLYFLLANTKGAVQGYFSYLVAANWIKPPAQTMPLLDVEPEN